MSLEAQINSALEAIGNDIQDLRNSQTTGGQILDTSTAQSVHVNENSFYAWERVDGTGYHAERYTEGTSNGVATGSLPIPNDLTTLNYL